MPSISKGIYLYPQTLKMLQDFQKDHPQSQVTIINTAILDQIDHEREHSPEKVEPGHRFPKGTYFWELTEERLKEHLKGDTRSQTEFINAAIQGFIKRTEGRE